MLVPSTWRNVGAALVPRWVGTLRSLPHSHKPNKICNRARAHAVISFKARRALRKQQTKQTMKRNLLAVGAAGAIALGAFIMVPRPRRGPTVGCGHGHAFGLRRAHRQVESDYRAAEQGSADPRRDQTANRHHSSGGDAENENRDGRRIVTNSSTAYP